MRVRARVLPFAAAAVMLAGGLSVSSEEGGGVQLALAGAPAQARFSLRRAFRRVGDKLKKVGKKIGAGIKKVAKKVGSGIKNVAKKVGEGLKKVGKAIGKAFKSIGDFAKKIKDKVVAKLAGFAKKMLDKAKGFIDGILNKLIGTIANKLGLGVDDINRIVDLKTGKINMAEVKKMIVGKISQRIVDFIEGKVRIVVDKVFSLVRPLLDSAVSAIVGAVGSIPFAGGAIAAAVSAAYSFGMVKLRDLAVTGVTKLVKKVIDGLLGKGFDFLVKRIAPLRKIVEKIVGQATRLYGMLGKAQQKVGAALGR